jgi:uncharacterized iron-regulated membrane protein
VLLGAFSAWGGWNWTPVYLAMALFFISAAVLFYLARRPAVEVHDTHLAIGHRTISWMDIRALDRTGWLAPLIVRITLFDNSRILLIYPGDIDSANSLLRHLRRSSREALIDGRTYQDFWGEGMPQVPEVGPVPSPRYRLLRPEDEAEVERLYQRLKTVRHLDPDSSGDEK